MNIFVFFVRLQFIYRNFKQMKKILTLAFSILLSTSLWAQDNPITNVELSQDTRLSGRGNAQDILLRAKIQCNGTSTDFNIQNILFSLDGTTRLSDIDSVNFYFTGSDSTFDWRNAQSATLIGSLLPASGNLSCPIQVQLHSGVNYLWLTVRVNILATEGDQLDASLQALVCENDTFWVQNPSPAGSREIILCRKTLYRPGDNNSSNYRIPAIITAKDGALVAITDKRKYNEGDLPEDIDIICNRSTDGGQTWSAPYTIAQGTGYNQGFGDCAVAWGNSNNELIAVFVGGVGLWNSTASNPLRSYMVRSLDNGQTWSTPTDITNFIFGSNCINTAHRYWRASFFGSGNGLRTSTGRIIFVAAIRETSAYSLNNYAVYSDDNGQTWQVSGRASVAGDEAKVTELEDGRILMSIRHADYRWYNISSDGGETWQSTTSTWNDLHAPACNGDIIRYTSVNHGSNKNRLLHSLPYGTERKNVSVYISYDEGETWPASRCIVPYSSAYSSLCRLNDGTIGLYVEEAYPGENGYSTVFYNFSLDWLSHGNDHFEPESSIQLAEKAKKLKIYPNPASTELYIDCSNLRNFQIFNISGQLIRTQAASDSVPVHINISSLPTGTYILQAIDTQNRYFQGKFIVQ